ncbi:hypothetical protein CkaCkLH20_12618 [Colletotrichum karsti]|uniref:PD-(D/E)XK nuclease-like domain-containing protein n=1 Tax=Colletotrichum karsti TaxID=1095194 RepID=A0A9P6LEB3_9PEZI|nr:uncharacterized protein CkaCkLH20_12618 [Colletotrichum karsti]KAF9869911.1 hypothetical protein CkaCkLH20_12618 [Colletotrichum karsti]
MAVENSIVYMGFDGPVAPSPKLYNLLSRDEALGRGISSDRSLDETRRITSSDGFETTRFLATRPLAIRPPVTRYHRAPLQRDELGPTASISYASGDLVEAYDAETVHHGERQWNTAIHRPLLHNALEHIQGIGGYDCTSAQIHTTRSDNSVSHNRKLRPRNRSILPTIPVLFGDRSTSVETKIASHGWANAVNRIAVWLIAQWDSLYDLVTPSSRLLVRPCPAAAAERLRPLPGIVVQGREWRLVAVTSKADGVPEPWTKTLMGSTITMQGVYQIPAVLQLLRRWIETECWLWSKTAVLKQT